MPKEKNAYDVEDIVSASRDTRDRSRVSRECNGMLTAAEHDALIIKGSGYLM